MNKLLNMVLALCCSLLLVACEDDEAATPYASMSINKLEFVINESMQLHFEGVANQVVVWTGDESHNYELRTENNSGFVVNKGSFSYSYSAPGIYKVVLVASTYNDLAADIKQDTCSYTVKVIDNHTEIEKLSCPQVLYDEVYAEAMNDVDWLMRLPRKVQYRNAAPTISLSQRLRFYLGSDSTMVTIDGEEYGSTKKYDLSTPKDILVTSNFGTTREYKLYTVQYPEFDTFTLAGVEGEVVRDAFDYTSFEMNVVLPAGTDVSALAPTFTTTDASEKVYIGDVEQVSGQSVADFTNGGVTYRLVSASLENPDYIAETYFKVNVTFE